MNYVQCSLMRGPSVDVAWIPQKFATVGRVLKIEEDGKWTDGWKVVQTYSTQMAEVVQTRERHYRHYGTVLDAD